MIRANTLENAMGRFIASLALATAGFFSLVLTFAPQDARASGRCVLPDNGSGTVNIPPDCDPFRSPRDVLFMRNGLPAGDYVLCTFQMRNVQLVSEIVGGSLGGHLQEFQAELILNLTGVGGLSNFNRMILMVVTGHTETAPRVGVNMQDFDMNIIDMFGQLFGDPDFDVLEVRAGAAFALPSPGHTTLWKRNNGDWAVDSFFDVEYRIDFTGAPGSLLDGFSGSEASGSPWRSAGAPRTLCVVPDVAGTADVPADCPDGHLSSPEVELMRGGLPEGAPMTGLMRIKNVQLNAEVPGGTLGGDEQTFTADVELDMKGSGDFEGFQNTVVIPVNGSSRTGPRGVGLLQGFPAELRTLQGQIAGDPVWDFLRIDAGSDLGLTSPGHTNLSDVPGGDWEVDSFFDVTYRITWTGAGAGPLAGFSGSHGSRARLEEGVPLESGTCTVPDVGGTADFPVACGLGYVAADETLLGLNGLPAGEPLLGRLTLSNFVINENPGGSLGGNQQTWTADVQVDVHGTGSLAAFSRSLTVPVSGTSHSGARGGGSTQSFPTTIIDLQGQVVGDPDFSLLKITAGSANNLTSDGHTSLSPFGVDWMVDSFFDVRYEIEFTGDPGGSLAGFGGTTVGVSRLTAGSKEVVSVPGPIPGALSVGHARPNPTHSGSVIEFDLPQPERVSVSVRDVAGRTIATVARGTFPAGRHVARWNGRDGDGVAVRSGVYFYSVRIGDGVVERRVTVVR